MKSSETESLSLSACNTPLNALSKRIVYGLSLPSSLPPITHWICTNPKRAIGQAGEGPDLMATTESVSLI